MSRDVSPESQYEKQTAFLEKLSELPPKSGRAPKEGTLLSLVLKWYGDLKQAKDRGYTYAELAEFLRTEAGILTTPGTLRKYMNRAAKEESGVVDASVDPIPLPQKAAPISKPVRNPSGEEDRLRPPRPTLYTSDYRTQVSEDEFENL